MSHDYHEYCKCNRCTKLTNAPPDDAKLAWTRVTELQARGTELLLELRATRRFARAWKALAKKGCILYVRELQDNTPVGLKEAADLANQRAEAAERSARAWKWLAKQTREDAQACAAEAVELESDLERAESRADYYEFECPSDLRLEFDDE